MSPEPVKMYRDTHVLANSTGLIPHDIYCEAKIRDEQAFAEFLGCLKPTWDRDIQVEANSLGDRVTVL